MNRYLQMTRYLLDSDVFISSKRHYYDMKFCPAFWDWLIRENKAGKLFSIDKVRKEFKGHDELVHWAAEEGQILFEPSSAEDIHPAMRELNKWIDTNNYKDDERKKFWEGADGYLVCCGRTYPCIVVTLEVSAPAGNRIKIPDACKALGVECITTFDMLRRENARFILKGK